jgi:hypothetical protein
LMKRLTNVVDALAKRPHPADVSALRKCGHALSEQILNLISIGQQGEPTAVVG